VKLIYAAVFALFPLAAPAQTLDSSLLSALCNDGYYEDTAGQCGAGEVLSIAAILEKYSAIVTRDADDDLADFFVSDPDDVPVGSISPRTGTPPADPAILTLPDDNCLDNEPAGERDAIASQITAPEPQLEKVAEHDEEDINITGPAANRIPGVAAAASAAVQEDDATSQ
jgi:hypothetical protein